jgi:hypothetical protein
LKCCGKPREEGHVHDFIAQAVMLLQRGLPVSLVACAAASLFHHVHNAEFLGEYPSRPVW